MSAVSIAKANLAPLGQVPDGQTAQSESGVSSQAAPNRHATDDEILGLGVRTRTRHRGLREEPDEPDADATRLAQLAGDGSSADQADGFADDGNTKAAIEEPGDPERFRELFDANPDLKLAWHEAQEYKESFATPEEARSATARLTDLNAIDALFFSKRAEDHAELAQLVARLDPSSFDLLAQAMSKVAAGTQSGRNSTRSNAVAEPPPDSTQALQETLKQQDDPNRLLGARQEFVQEANAAAVRGVMDAIELQVERLLPENVSKAARNRVAGEVYRELDASLQSNGHFVQQIRSALQSGSFDNRHQAAVVSLIVGRARQALPSVAKRVLNEWTSTIVAANQDRRVKQRSAESRVDIGGARGVGNEGHRSKSPRDIDYGRMSDSDILNL